MELKARLSLETIQDSKNLCTELSEDDLETIGNDVVTIFDIDKESRSEWEKKMEDANKLALQVKEAKSSPWERASNVKFPLLTIAALQFASRAYPALVKAPDLVKYRKQGSDDNGQKAARSQRISAHMSYQLLEEDEGWEEDHDKALFCLPITGCIFKKSYYDAVDEHNRSPLVLPKNLVVHYYAKSIEKCERKTEIFELYDREVRERELRGTFKENDYDPEPVGDIKEEDKRQGLTPPLNDPSKAKVFLEQHRYLDLDGDGYNEPYIVTVHKGTKKVARIVHRIDTVVTEQSVEIEETQKRIRALAEGVQPPSDRQISQQELQQAQQVEQSILGMQEQIKALAAEKQKILKINPVEHYTKYPFIPSPDGGFYDIGFGQLMADLGDSVNTLINQLIDSGSLQNSNSGFIGRGVRIKGGRVRFQLNEWKRVESTGQSLRDGIVPLPVNPPSEVLFNLLSLLISYVERIGSVTDAMMGENPGQNTPAYNMSAMLEQGLQVFNGIFKRVYRSQRSEFRKLFKLNSIYLDQEEYFTYQDSDNNVLKVDYTADPKDLIPAADPNAFSNKEKMMKANLVFEMSQAVPGFDPIKVVQGQLEAMDISNSAEVYPTQQNPETGVIELVNPPQPDPELEIEKADMQRRTLEGQARAEKDFMVAEADILLKEAQAAKALAEAESIGDPESIERIRLILDEMSDRRKTLVEMAKIDKEEKNVALTK